MTSDQHAARGELGLAPGAAAAEAEIAAAWRLRPYQVEALRAISREWQERARTLLVLATGLGKTTVAAEVLLRRRAAGRGRALAIAHRLELVDQLAERFEAGGLTVEIESGDRMASPASMTPSDVVVATVQTLKGRRLERWSEDVFGTVVYDEAHHAVAAGSRAILDRFAGAKTLGMTATPDRGDEVALGHVFESIAMDYGIREGVRDGWLAPIRLGTIDAPSIDLSTVRVSRQEHGRDLAPEDLARQMRGDHALHEIAAPVAERVGDRPTIVFTPTVEVAHELAIVLSGYLGDGRVKSLDGTSSKGERVGVLRDYRAGSVQVLVNCALFTEGFDAPHTACIVVARPTRSRALYAQMVGRGTRLAAGKADLLVLNLVPSNDRHVLVSPADLFSGAELPEDLRQQVQRDLLEGEEVLRAVSKAEEMAREREAARARASSRQNVVATARYHYIERDPFDELGITGSLGGRGPRATGPMLAALARAGIDLGPQSVSIGEARGLLDELARRRREGLCTLKQARQLARHGLRTDLPFAEAGEVMTALAANGWRMTAQIAERWGEP